MSFHALTVLTAVLTPRIAMSAPGRLTRVVIMLLTGLIVLSGAQTTLAVDLVPDWPKVDTVVGVEGGQLQDFTIPLGFEGELYVRVEGGDGGNARASLDFITAFGVGGPGAAADAAFRVGPGANQIPGGSILRYIIGRRGDSANERIVKGESEPTDALDGFIFTQFGGGGGGGTAAYVKVPGSDTWEFLVGAGGGGGGIAKVGLSLDIIPIPIPYSGDGRYGRYQGDGYGNTLTGGDGAGLPLTVGEGGTYLEGLDLGNAGGAGIDSYGGGGTAGPAAGAGGGRANPDALSPGGVGTGSEERFRWNGGSGWGGGGSSGGGSVESGNGGGGGGFSGGGGGGVAGGGGGGGGGYGLTYKTPDPESGRIVSRAAKSEARLPQDGRGLYALYPVAGSRVFTEDTTVTTDYTIFAIESWVINPGVVLTFKPGVDVRIEAGGSLSNSGTIVNEGRIRNIQATITNLAGGVINNITPGSITNTGSIVNDGAIYRCFKPIDGTQPTGTAAVPGCYLAPDYGGERTCELALSGIWNGADTCTLTEDYQLFDGLSLTIGEETTLALEATLTNDGIINNLGVIDNELGTLNDCGAYSGNEPMPFPRVDCELSADAQFCVNVLGGVWSHGGQHCTINDFSVSAGDTFTIGAGYTLYVTGTLENSGTLDNEGTIVDQRRISNNEDAVINNYGVILTDLGFDSAEIYNLGTVDNYGSIDIVANGAIFDNAGVGYLINRCGAVYTGPAPLNSASHGGVSNEPCPADPKDCGDADANETVTATDALNALFVAVGLSSCDLCRCDINGSSSVTAADALGILRLAVGQEVALMCSAC